MKLLPYNKKNTTIESLGFFFQCFKRKKATYETLQSVRKFYPRSNIVLFSDGGDDFTDIAAYFRCRYYFRDRIFDGKNGVMSTQTQAMQYIGRLKEACEIIDETWIMLLEDDVSLISKISAPLTEAAGPYQEPLPDNIKSYIQKFSPSIDPRFYGCCGGTVFKKSALVRACDEFIKHNYYFDGWETLRALDIRSNGLSGIDFSDFLLSVMLYLAGIQYGRLPGHHEGCYEPGITAARNIEVIHQYKNFYKTPFVEPLVLAPEGYVLVALGDQYLEELKIHLSSKKDQRPFSVVVLPRHEKDAMLLTNSVIVYDEESSEKILGIKHQCDFEKFGTTPKIRLIDWSVYEKTIFIDVDTIFMNDSERMWDLFNQGPAFGIVGRIDDEGGSPPNWHWGHIREVEGRLGIRIPQVSGAIIYFRKLDPLAQSVFREAASFYHTAVKTYGAKTYFRGGIPDEILFAMSMAKNNVKPYDIDESYILTYEVEKAKDYILSHGR